MRSGAIRRQLHDRSGAVAGLVSPNSHYNLTLQYDGLRQTVAGGRVKDRRTPKCCGSDLIA